MPSSMDNYADDEIVEKVMQILKDHASKSSDSNLNTERAGLCIEKDRFADVTQAIVSLVRSEIAKHSDKMMTAAREHTGIVESIIVPEVNGHHLNVSTPIKHSIGHFGSSSTIGRNIEGQHDEHDSFVLEALPMNVDDTQNFASTKVVAEGMMDIALLTANANQLRFLFAYNRTHETFTVSLSLIVTSLVIQMLVGIGLLLKNRLRRANDQKSIQLLHDLLVIGVYMVTVINIMAATTTLTGNA